VKLFLLCLALLCHVSSVAQNLSGYVYDTGGKPLVAANIVLLNLDRGTSTNSEGYYKFENLNGGLHAVEVSYIGYKAKTKSIKLGIGEEGKSLNFDLQEQSEYLNELIISSLRIGEEEPFTHVDISREYIEQRNLGQDIPFLLNHTPSTVVTSDAGTGIGYTGIRIRGSDPTRINVTINGIPYNDPESQGVFWVNLPDFASTTNDIQITRGVGASTNGSGAFGASINMSSLKSNNKAYGTLSNSVGSFNTRKHTIALGTGLLNDKFTFDGRLSTIKSDGYIDRATANLNSYYLSGSYYTGNSTIKAITFSGHEVTYQSWWGTPQSRLDGNPASMLAHAANNGLSESQTNNLLNSGRTYNFYEYENQVDDYQQDHYQLHFSHEASKQLSLTAALHYTKGKGFFEQFKADDDYEDYGLSMQNGKESGDLVRRRWLDNDFYGVVVGVDKQSDNLSINVGGAYHIYEGDHFGEIIWGQHLEDIEKDYRYYDNTGNKSEANLYSKFSINATPNLNVYTDLQVRSVDYRVDGIDNDQRKLSVDDQLFFFNPKFGLSYKLQNRSKLYFSYARGSREPDRNDYVDAANGVTPQPEFLNDFELGYGKEGRISLNANLYYMQYKDQLVPTGALNDVGSTIRMNVPDSYRLGLELDAGYQISNELSWAANLTLSKNKISAFTEIIYDYTTSFDIVENTYEDTDISFSPSIVGGSTFSYSPIDNFKASLMSKYVGKQYLDNTSDESKIIDAFFVNDLLLNFDFKFKGVEKARIDFQVSNLLNTMYSSNGYTYSYIFGDTITENFYYPQAGINVLLGLTIGF